MSEPARIAVVGTGWRSEFFMRIAAAVPDRLRVVAAVSRSAEKAATIQERWGVPGVTTIEEALAHRPDVVAPAVPWPDMPRVIEELVDAGAHVLAETPPAPDADGLRALWSRVGASGRVQVAEQYLLMPGHAARLVVVRDGVIGDPTSVQVSSTHWYHATSMIRFLLDVGMAPATVTARAFTAPLVDPLTPAGPVDDPQPQPRATTMGLIDFGDGRHGLYDFTDNQWWNMLRSRRLVVRGTRGELSDDTVVRWADGDPVTSRLEYRRTGHDLNLEGNDLVHVSFDGRVVYRNPWVGSRLNEDDIAVASILADAGAWARGEGPAPYPLAEACQDHLLALAIQEAATTGRDVSVGVEPWAG